MTGPSGWRRATLRNLRGLLASMYADAVLDNLVASSPVTRRIKLPRSERPRIEVLTVEQVNELVNAMAEIRPTVVRWYAQAGLGLRLGELLALRREDVNLAEPQSQREWSTSARSCPGHGNDQPKTPEFLGAPSRAMTTTPRGLQGDNLDTVMTGAHRHALAAHLATYPPPARVTGSPRFNRWTSSVGGCCSTVLQHSVDTDPHPLKELIGGG